MRKETGSGEDLKGLTSKWRGQWHTSLLARGSRDPKEFIKFLFTQGRVPKDPDHRRHAQAEEGRMTPTLPPCVRPSLLHAPTFC